MGVCAEGRAEQSRRKSRRGAESFVGACPTQVPRDSTCAWDRKEKEHLRVFLTSLKITNAGRMRVWHEAPAVSPGAEIYSRRWRLIARENSDAEKWQRIRAETGRGKVFLRYVTWAVGRQLKYHVRGVFMSAAMWPWGGVLFERYLVRVLQKKTAVGTHLGAGRNPCFGKLFVLGGDRTCRQAPPQQAPADFYRFRKATPRPQALSSLTFRIDFTGMTNLSWNVWELSPNPPSVAFF